MVMVDEGAQVLFEVPVMIAIGSCSAIATTDGAHVLLEPPLVI